MKNKLSIGIVTFRQRVHLIKDLIKQLRSYVPEEIDIILAVNGNNEEEMLNSYREDMLSLCLDHKNVFPIICPEFKSLCKLWNTIVIFSKTEYNFILCDDVISENPQVLSQIDQYITNSNSEFFTINNQFSHFVLTKTMLHNLGYFDERLSGFGEEDGDIIHRYIEVYGTRMPDIRVNGLYNKGSYELRNEKIETHIDNKPRFNREFIMKKYAHDPSGIYGMSPIPVKKIMEDYQQYPYEMFVIKNKHNISKFDKIIFDEQY